MITALLLFAAGLVVGVLLDRWRERRYWRRMFLRTFTRPPMIVTPPTVTELRRPDWLRAGDGEYGGPDTPAPRWEDL